MANKAIAFKDSYYLDSSSIRLESNHTLKQLLPYGNKFIDLGQSLQTDPTNSFQTTLFGINSGGMYKLACTRAGSGGKGDFSAYGCSIVAATGDTHMFLTTDYWANGRARIGAGNGDKVNWSYTIPREKIVLWEGQLVGGSSITLSGWRRFIDIYFRINFDSKDGTGKYTIDTTCDEPTCSGGMITPFDENNMHSIYESECVFYKSTGKLEHTRIGYYVFSTHTWESRNDRANGYYVYRVETYD